MNRELIKELLDDSGIVWATYDKCYQADLGDIEHFAELVRKDYLEEINGHTLRMVMIAIAREREACAQLCDDEGRVVPWEVLSKQSYRLADLIRARTINSINEER